jgi:hypothetical protein
MFEVKFLLTLSSRINIPLPMKTGEPLEGFKLYALAMITST